ncbi:MAG: hypothetical protein M1833_006883 [Piccolia ochrophora]|nr:MAG: hypothetical protein M1833_006883 [Piccolia ochrophora]
MALGFLWFVLLALAGLLITPKVNAAVQLSRSITSSLQIQQQPSHEAFPFCHDYLIIAGSGGTSFDSRTIEDLVTALIHGPARRGGRVEVIGTGNDTIHLSHISSGLAEFMSTQKRSFCIILWTHGEVKNGKFSIQQKGTNGIDSTDLFNAISDAVGEVPISILTTACYGNYAMADLGLLPAGTIFVGLSDIWCTAFDFEAWIEAVPDMTLTCSILDLLYLYLLHGLQNRLSPVVAIANFGVFHLDTLLQRLGYQIPVLESTIEFMSKLSGMPQDIARVANLVNTRQTIYAVDYGKALALILDTVLRRVVAVPANGRQDDSFASNGEPFAWPAVFPVRDPLWRVRLPTVRTDWETLQRRTRKFRLLAVNPMKGPGAGHPRPAVLKVPPPMAPGERGSRVPGIGLLHNSRSWTRYQH